MPTIDLFAALKDVVAVTAAARSATSGWRAACVRERRQLGASVADALAALDLDIDVDRVAGVVRRVAARADATVGDADMLVFGLFDAVDDESGGAGGGFHVAPVASHRRHVDEVMCDPWGLERTFLRSDTLDAIARISRAAERPVRPLLDYVLTFGAAALTSRFAVRVAGLEHRVVVAFDEDHGKPPPRELPRYAEIVAVERAADRGAPLASFVPRLLQSC